MALLFPQSDEAKEQSVMPKQQEIEILYLQRWKNSAAKQNRKAFMQPLQNHSQN
jgi:hypothetical protein